jgi:hypothetical protein
MANTAMRLAILVASVDAFHLLIDGVRFKTSLCRSFFETQGCTRPAPAPRQSMEHLSFPKPRKLEGNDLPDFDVIPRGDFNRRFNPHCSSWEFYIIIPNRGSRLVVAVFNMKVAMEIHTNPTVVVGKFLALH